MQSATLWFKQERNKVTIQESCHHFGQWRHSLWQLVYFAIHYYLLTVLASLRFNNMKSMFT